VDAAIVGIDLGTSATKLLICGKHWEYSVAFQNPRLRESQNIVDLVVRLSTALSWTSDLLARKGAQMRGLAVTTSWPSLILKTSTCDELQFPFDSPLGDKRFGHSYMGGTLVTSVNSRISFTRQSGIYGGLKVSTFGSRIFELLTGVELIDQGTFSHAGLDMLSPDLGVVSVPKVAKYTHNEVWNPNYESFRFGEFKHASIAVGTGDTLAACELALASGATGTLWELGSTVIGMKLNKSCNTPTVIASLPAFSQTLLELLGNGKQDTSSLKRILAVEQCNSVNLDITWQDPTFCIEDGVVRLDIPALKLPKEIFKLPVEMRIRSAIRKMIEFTVSASRGDPIIYSGGLVESPVFKDEISKVLLKSQYRLLGNGTVRGAAFIAAKSIGDGELTDAILSKAIRI
jgi:hypothetical protein